MNDELRHANNYKYIKREWKNGKWQYTYKDDKSVSSKKTPFTRPKNITSNKVASVSKRTPQRPTSSRPKNITSNKVAEVYRRPAEPIDKVKTAMQKTANKSVQYVPKVKTAMQVPAQPVKKERSLKDKIKDALVKGANIAEKKLSEIKFEAKVAIKSGEEFIKDKLGYDEKSRLDAATKRLETAMDNTSRAYDEFNKRRGQNGAYKILDAAQQEQHKVAQDYHLAKTDYDNTPLGAAENIKKSATKIADKVDKKVAEISDDVMDALGADEKRRYENATKSRKPLENQRKKIEKEIDEINKNRKRYHDPDKLIVELKKNIEMIDKNIENSDRYTEARKKEYSRTVIGVVNNGRDWLEKLFKIK